MRINSLRFLLGSLLSLAVAQVASAYVYILDSTINQPIKWTNSPVVMHINVGNTPTSTDTNLNQAVVAAVGVWNANLSIVQLAASVDTTPSSDGDTMNEMFFDTTVYGRALGDGTLAVTTAWTYPGFDQRSEADIVFNGNPTLVVSGKTYPLSWDSYRGPLAGHVTSGGIIMDIRRIAIHELGHVLGLTHPDLATPPQSVTAIMNSSVSDLDTLAADDITGAQHLYGGPGAAAPANDNFVNAALITSNDGTPYYGSNVYPNTASREAGEPLITSNHGGRSVWWKWVAPYSGSVTIDTHGSYFDTMLGVYTGSAVSALTLVAENDEEPGNPTHTSLVTFTAIGGTTYYIAVDGYYFNDGKGKPYEVFGDTGDIALHVTQVNPNVAPTISNPANTTVAAGNTAQFTISATGVPTPTLQWQRQPAAGGGFSNLSNGGAYSGANSATLTVGGSGTTSGNSGDQFRCVASNTAGTATSAAATLTVVPFVLPTITAQPQPVTVAEGANASFSVTATSPTTMTYAWQESPDGSSWYGINDNSLFSGTTTSTLTLSGVLYSQVNGYSFRCVVTNLSGPTTSNGALLTVTRPPAVVRLSAGRYHSFRLDSSSQLFATGANTYGQLGTGNTTTTSTPQLITIPGQTVVDVAAGAQHSLFLTSSHQLWATGYNANGQLGDGTTNARSTPYLMASNVAGMAASVFHSAYFKTDGTLWTVGGNDSGQLGNGNQTDQSTAVQIATDVVDVAAGNHQTLFVKADGTLWGTGDLYNNGTLTSTPVQIATGVKTVAVGAFHTLILKADGTLWTMGFNLYGQLGDGTTTTRTTPVQIATNVKSVAAGYFFSLFIKTDNYLWLSGYNSFGQLGDGTTNQRTTPYQFAGNVAAATASESYTLYTRYDGALLGTGYNANGQFGNGGTTTVYSPVQITAGNFATPSVPTGLVAVVNGAGNGLNLTWQPGGGAAGYEVWRGTTNNFGSATRLAQNIRWSFYEDLTAAINTPYYYWVTAVNPAGTSAPSLVAPGSYGTPTAPSFTTQPQPQSVSIGASASFSVAVSGIPASTLQWQRLPAGGGSWSDLSNSGSYAGVTTSTLTVSNTTLGMSGDQFRCVATNSVSSTTSNAATLTVTVPANAILFNSTTFPASAAVQSNVTFTCNVTNTGTGTWGANHLVWLQDWNHSNAVSASLNGIAPGGSTTLSFTFGTPSSAGTYTYYLQATQNGVGNFGSSFPLTLTVVVVPQPPLLSNWLNRQDITPNFGVDLYMSVAGGAASYQWYKDGVAIPGATSASYLIPGQAHRSDAGNYSLLATNAAGVAMSPDIPVVWAGPLGTPWTDAGRVGDVVYFLYAASPGVISRYDLSTESWLPQVTLTGTPTAFLPTAEGVFIAYGTSVVRRTADLQPTETPVATSSSAVTRLLAFGSLVYFENSPNIVAYNRSTLALAQSFTASYWQDQLEFRAATETAFSASSSQGYYIDGNAGAVRRFNIAGDGTFNSETLGSNSGVFAVGKRLFLTPDSNLVITSGGAVFRTSDLKYSRGAGVNIDDLTFLGDGTPVALRGPKLVTLNPDHFFENGQVALAGNYYRVFGRGTSSYVFGDPAVANGNPSVTVVWQSTFTVPPLPAAYDASGQHFSTDDMFINANGVINILSRSGQGVVRWGVQARNFLPTLPIHGRPAFASYAPNYDRYALDYLDGRVSQFFFPAGQDEWFSSAISAPVWGMVAMDDLTIFNFTDNGGTTGDSRLVLTIDGYTDYVSGSGFYGSVLTWDWNQRRLYSYTRGTIPGNGVSYEDVPVTGIPPGPNYSTAGLTAPFIPNATGTRFLAVNGVVTNATLGTVATLTNSVVDGAFLPDGLYTIRAQVNTTQVQKWSADTSSGQLGSLTVPGLPLRIFRYDDFTLVAVTNVNGYLAFHTISSALSLIDSSVNDYARPPLTAPVITSNPSGQAVNAGSPATFTAAATGNPTPTLQWQRLPAGGGGWSSLSNGGSYAGVTTGTLTVSSTTGGMNGDQFRCVATNIVNSVNSTAATLTVTGGAAVSNDFNGDGKGDMVWENTVSGDRYLWFMNGSAITGALDLGVIPSAWRIGGVGDLNGDGKPDIVWENTVTGDRYIWFMDGSAITSAVDLGIISTDWRIGGVGDLNGDGKADMLWENTVTGDRYIWFMNGSTITSAVDLGIISTDWRIGAVGDLDGDGNADMLWENTVTGDRYIWFMNGSTITSAVDLGIISTDWSIGGTGDFNGDGKADILWENTVTGDRYIWFMNRSTITSAVDLGIISTDWRTGN